LDIRPPFARRKGTKENLPETPSVARTGFVVQMTHEATDEVRCLGSTCARTVRCILVIGGSHAHLFSYLQGFAGLPRKNYIEVALD
jgi:hypothetical protein